MGQPALKSPNDLIKLCSYALNFAICVHLSIPVLISFTSPISLPFSILKNHEALPVISLHTDIGYTNFALAT